MTDLDDFLRTVAALAQGDVEDLAADPTDALSMLETNSLMTAARALITYQQTRALRIALESAAVEPEPTLPATELN